MNGAPLTAAVYEQTHANGVWQTAMPMLGNTADPYSFNNGVILGDRATLWFDRQPKSLAMPRVIGHLGLQTFDELFHPELPDVKQPAITSDGTHLYYSRTNTSELQYGTITGNLLGNESTLVNPAGLTFESASVSQDGTALYVTGSDAMFTSIYLAIPNALHTGYTDHQRVDPFQLEGHDYFDPSLSPDGATLVFASTFESARPRIYYVTRNLGCAP